MDKQIKSNRENIMAALYLEAKKIIFHIENKKNRLNELLNDEIKVFYSFLQRVEKLPNTKDLQRLLKEKMTDLDALKGYNFSNGTLDGSDFITSGRVVNVKSPNGNQLTFTLHDYFPQPHKYTKWLIHQNNKTLTKNDVLSLLLYISKSIGLDTNEEKKDIEKDFNTKIALKDPPYKTIIIEDALIMTPLDVLEPHDGVYYLSRDGTVNTPMNCGTLITSFIEHYLSGNSIVNGNNLALLNEHHLKIYNLINS